MQLPQKCARRVPCAMQLCSIRAIYFALAIQHAERCAVQLGIQETQEGAQEATGLFRWRRGSHRERARERECRAHESRFAFAR